MISIPAGLPEWYQIRASKVGRKVESRGQQIRSAIFIFLTPPSTVNSQQSTMIPVAPESILFIQRGKILPSADLASLAASWKQARVRYCWCEFDTGQNTENYSLDPGSFIFRLSRVLAAAGLCQQKEVVFQFLPTTYPWRMIDRSRILTLIKMS